jgi:hypothetical protein
VVWGVVQAGQLDEHHERRQVADGEVSVEVLRYTFHRSTVKPRLSAG